MSNGTTFPDQTLDRAKFRDPSVTANGAPRAKISFASYETLWFNTGSLCNLTCRNCYIESSPTNDSLVYLSLAEVEAYLDELAGLPLAGESREIGFTGGEPFMNPDIMAMLRSALERGHRVLVLTNAMRPMRRHEQALRDLVKTHGDRLVIRVSLDHYTQDLHEIERGEGAWPIALDGLKWLSRCGFTIAVAGRTCWGETPDRTRAGYARLFASQDIPIDAHDPAALVLFPEMDASLDVPEVSESCMTLPGVHPEDIMCASSRMIVKRKGATHPVVMPCTLLPYGAQFELGETLAEATQAVHLNHPHCSRFCVLGGGSCSKGG